MKLHRTVPLDARTLKESIQLLFPGILTVTTGAFWTPPQLATIFATNSVD